MTEQPVISTRVLSKSYGEVQAVRDLSFAVAPGRITGFLGRNGAGKSTTIKMLLGMIRPTSGEGSVLGKSIVDAVQSVELRRRVAYVSEDKRLYDYMTVEQIIRFSGAFYADWRPEVAADLMFDYELPAKRKVRKLSKGMRTKLALLLAFSRRPQLLILDEPSEGLDPVGIEQLLQALVARCAEGATVFFSSHQIDEVERIADHVAILDEGRLIRDASLDDIRQYYRRIDLSFDALPAQHEFLLNGVESIETRGRQMSVFASRNADAVIERARDFHANSIEVAPIGLRDVFLKTVKEN